jgi:transposase
LEVELLNTNMLGEKRAMKETQTTKSQTKAPADRGAVHILAFSIGAREAARRLGIKESTVLSWSRRLKWKLPRRKVGRPSLEVKEDPSEVLLDYKRRGGLTRLDMARAVAAAAERLAGIGGKGGV